MKITRVWAMPSAETFSIPPIAEFISRWLHGVSADPFARNTTIATYTNDLDPVTRAAFHMDAAEFCACGTPNSLDSALFDPPYSPRQISECYKGIGRPVTGKGTQNAALYARVRDTLAPLIKPEGVVLSFGWNSAGMGKKRGFEIEEIMLVAHGGAHNDTICVAERKRKKN